MGRTDNAKEGLDTCGQRFWAACGNPWRTVLEGSSVAIRVHWWSQAYCPMLPPRSNSLPIGLLGGGSGMWKELRVYVAVAALAFISVVAFLAIKLVSSARMLNRAERSHNERVTVIRHPNSESSKGPGRGEVVHNIAPLATVTVSSIDEFDERLGGGVADGVVDTKEWVAREEMAGAWIKLNWDRPALVTEIALYDRPDRVDNVLSGTLTFDDGTSIAVPALPAAGSPWHITISPKVVHWLMFRIDRAEGRNTGLEEIMVMGTQSQ
jgi:hypothetical protein